MTPRPHVLDDCWCGQYHHEQIRGGGDDPRVHSSDSRAESQAGLNGPSGSLNPSPRRAPGRMEQDEFNSRLDAGEDAYSVVADDLRRLAEQNPSKRIDACDKPGCDKPMTGYDSWGQWCDEHNGGLADSNPSNRLVTRDDVQGVDYSRKDPP